MLPFVKSIYSNQAYLTVFTVWRESIRTFCDWLFCIIQSAKFQVQSSHLTFFFRYLQVRHYVREKYPQYDSAPTKHPFLEKSFAPTRFQMVGVKNLRIASTLRYFQFTPRCSRDLNSEISGELLEQAMSHNCSLSSCCRLIQQKVIHRLHYSIVKLNQIFPSVASICDSRKSADKSLAHLLWCCPVLCRYQAAIFVCLSKAYSCDLQPNHDLAIFACSAETLELPSDIQNALHLEMVVA